MKRATLAGLLLALSVGPLNAGSVMATDRLLETERADPLQPATLALLQGDNRHAWQSLQQAWPALNSDAERRSWQGMLAVLSAQHCGKDFPLTLPDGVSELRLELIQRDAPLLRDYRVQLTGEGPSPPLNLSIPLVATGWKVPSGRRKRTPESGVSGPIYRRLCQPGSISCGWRWRARSGRWRCHCLRCRIWTGSLARRRR